MRHIINLSYHKIITVAIAALAAFFGLEAAGFILKIYQPVWFLKVALDVYIFLLFWQMFIFDLHLKRPGTLEQLEKRFWHKLKDRFEYLKHKHHWLHFQNYLILPGIIYWAAVVLIFLNPFAGLIKQVIIISATIALALSFWYLKTVFLNHREAGKNRRQLIFLTKLFASFFAFAAAFGITRYFGYGQGLFAALIFALTFLLLYQALFQHHFLGYSTLKFLLGSSAFLGISAYFIYSFWNVNYYSGALTLAAVYNTIWGIIHHHWIDKNLTREMVYEYLAVLFVILVIVFSTTNFAERI